jgi:DNA-binding beta-propeller fold protein YncE
MAVLTIRTARCRFLVLLLAALVPVLGHSAPAGAQSAPGSFVNFEAGHVRPLALSPDGTRLFAVNTPDARLAIFDVTATGLVLAAEVPVGLEPVTVAARTDDEVWVVNHLSDSVSIVRIDPADVTRSRVVRTLFTCDEPRDLVFAGPSRRRAFVTGARRGQNCPVTADSTTPGLGRAVVQVFDASALGAALGGTPIANVVLFGDTPRALAVTPDGATVYAAIFHSGNGTTTVNERVVSANGGLPPPASALPNGPDVGLIVREDPDTGRFEDELGRDWSPFVAFSLPDEDVFAIDANGAVPAAVGSVSGVGTTLFNMAVRPGSGKLFVSNTEARNQVRFEGIVPDGVHGVRGSIAQSRITVVDGATVTPRHLNGHIDYARSPGPASEVEQTVAFPTGLAFSSDGRRLYVAALGSSRVAVIDADGLESGFFGEEMIEVGGGPTGLVLDEARDRLYVMSRFTQRVGIVSHLSDRNARAETDAVSLRFDPTPPVVRQGRRVLYDARHTSGHGDAACASCHTFGDLDSLAWDLGDASAEAVAVPNPNPFRSGTGRPFHPLKGPMTTQSLRGMAGAGPMHWRGDRTGGASGGDPLDEELAFKAFNPAFVGLLGRGSQLPDAEMQAFTDFALTLAYPPNPIRALDDVPNAAEAAGENFFLTLANTDGVGVCQSCHRLPFGTDGFSTTEGETQEFKIAHLRNLYQKVGMFGVPANDVTPGTGFLGDQVRGFGILHDGSLATVFNFISARQFNFGANQSVATQRRRAVEAFLLAFDTGLKPVVGQQVTLSTTSASDPATVARLDLLIARHEAGDCELVGHGVVAGEQRGALYAGNDRFLTDRAADGLVPTAALRAVAAVAGQEQVFTCVPPGAGVRAGIDRDSDGRFDRDELDAGTDPADPTSFPGAAALVTVQTTALRLADDSTPPANPSRRRISFRSSTRTDTTGHRIVSPPFGSAADPTIAGATLRVYNSDGSGEQFSVALPASGWLPSGAGGYRFRGASTDPVQSVTVKNDLITVRGGKDGWGYTLDEPAQGRIAVRLSFGTTLDWCADAPAKASGRPPTTAANDRQDKFVAAAKTPPPSSCPIPPMGSPSGAFLDGNQLL